MEFTNNNEVNAMKRETLKAKFKKRGIVLPGRLIVTSLLILVQIAFFILVEAYLKQWSSIIYGFVELLSLIFPERAGNCPFHRIMPVKIAASAFLN